MYTIKYMNSVHSQRAVVLCGNSKGSHTVRETDVVTLQTSLGSDFPVDETKEQKTSFTYRSDTTTR